MPGGLRQACRWRNLHFVSSTTILSHAVPICRSLALIPSHEEALICVARLAGSCVALLVSVVSVSSVAQTAGSNATTACNFDPNKQLAVEYQKISVNPKKKVLGDEIAYGKVWTPGDKPMKLFTNTRRHCRRQGHSDWGLHHVRHSGRKEMDPHHLQEHRYQRQV